jgi:hypothetical protein
MACSTSFGTYVKGHYYDVYLSGQGSDPLDCAIQIISYVIGIKGCGPGKKTYSCHGIRGIF